jgi:folate-binding protein YgfZ
VKLVGPGSVALAESVSTAAAAAGSIGWFGTEGAALVVGRDSVSGVTRERLARAGANARELSPEGWDALRLTHALPAFGKDYGSDDNPHQAALDRRAVSWDKGCYLGQEVVCMQDMRGRLKRRLAVLRVQGGAIPSAGTSVLASDSSDPVGEVRTAARAEDGAALVFAVLRAPYFDAPDRGLSVEGLPAEILAFRAP